MEGQPNLLRLMLQNVVIAVVNDYFELLSFIFDLINLFSQLFIGPALLCEVSRLRTRYCMPLQLLSNYFKDLCWLPSIVAYWNGYEVGDIRTAIR